MQYTNNILDLLVTIGYNIQQRLHIAPRGWNLGGVFGTRDLFNISYSRELYLFSKFLHFEEIVRVKMAICFEMIVSET